MKCAVCHRELESVRFRLRHDGRRKAMCMDCEARILRKREAQRCCHDCGMPTNNFRCSRCWSLLRKGEPAAKSIDPQYLP